MGDTIKESRAFDLVKGNDWRGPINAWVSDIGLHTDGLTIDDVLAGVLYYTATSARITRERDGWRVRAVGYRNGPAGP